jgi:hypothetical protein
MTHRLWPCRRPTRMLSRLLRASSSVADVMPASRHLDLPSFLDRRKILATGRRVLVRRSRSHATARRADLDAEAGSGTMDRRGRRHRAALVVWPGQPGWVASKIRCK